MLTIELGPELEEQLANFAKEAGKTKECYAAEALREYLEDREDYLLGIAALEREDGPTKSLGELLKQFDLEH